MGQLGHGDTADQAQPKRVTGMGRSHIVHVACGGHFTMAVTSSGK